MQHMRRERLLQEMGISGCFSELSSTFFLSIQDMQASREAHKYFFICLDLSWLKLNK